MFTLADFFELNNPTLSILIGIGLVLISAVISFMCFKTKANGSKSSKSLPLLLSIVSLVLAAGSGFIAYHYLIVVGHVASLIALSFSLAKLSLAINFGKGYKISFASLTLKFLMPVAIASLAFGPWFLDLGFYNSTTSYSILSMFGMKGVGVYAFTFENLHIITFVELGLFLTLVGVQIYTIIQLFVNPDYCDGWSLFHLILTVVVTLFINGIYTSDNMLIMNVMPSASETLAATYLMYMILVLAAINKLLYIEKIDAWISGKRVKKVKTK